MLIYKKKIRVQKNRVVEETDNELVLSVNLPCFEGTLFSFFPFSALWNFFLNTHTVHVYYIDLNKVHSV